MPVESITSRGISLDDALINYVGEFGRSQIRILLLASLFWVGNALFILLMVFHASPSPVKEHWWRCNHPNDMHCAAVFALTDPSREICDLPHDAWSWTQQSKSIISKFNLICSAAWRSQFANSGFFMGYLIGSGVFGSVADTRGRKPVLFGCTALGAVFTVAAGLSPNYAAYFSFRLLTGIGAAGQALTAYILATESVGPRWRGTAGVATQMFFIVGEFVLVLVAYLARPWRVLCFACGAINAVLLVLWPTLPESPRWLLVRGRKQEATAILVRIAAENRRAMPSEPLADAGSGSDTAPLATPSSTFEVDEDGSQHLREKPSQVQMATAAAATTGTSSFFRPVTLTAMLRRDRHMLRRFLVLAYVWLVMCMAYYGISLALGGLLGSIYVTFMITAAAELPSNILAAWMIERYGRHNTMAAGMLLGGAACLGCAFAPAGIISALMAAVGKFGCAGAFTVASIFTSELFPTLVRSAVLGAENEAARVGGISAPFIVLVGISTGQAAVPFIIFGVTSLLAGVAIFTLPETLGTKLPDTLSDMNGIKSIFTTQPWRRGGWRQTLREVFRARGGPPASSAVDTLAKERASGAVPTLSVHVKTPPSMYGQSVVAASGSSSADQGGGSDAQFPSDEISLMNHDMKEGALQTCNKGPQHPSEIHDYKRVQHRHHHHQHLHHHHHSQPSGDGNGDDERHALLHASTSKSDALVTQRPGSGAFLGNHPIDASADTAVDMHRNTRESLVDGSLLAGRESESQRPGPVVAPVHGREELRRFP